jgi:LytS/YehU family sensor histidine kinase
MQFLKSMSAPVRLQWLIWLFVLFILFFSMLPEEGFIWSLSFTLINTLFYALVIYGNINLLYPMLYLKGWRITYALVAIVFLVTAGLSRGYLTLSLYNTYVAKQPEPVTIRMMTNYIAGALLIFVLSFIFRIAIAYFKLKQHAEEIMLEKAQAELNLLKLQVQPHFLFNTLNNIYYEAYRDSPQTAILIERLSEIMRYFVDESPKNTVFLSTEIIFLENYIALEKIRIPHQTSVKFIKQVEADCRIPPMLLMTFVENIFKHGIDKTRRRNSIEISLTQKDNWLTFKTRNQLTEISKFEGVRGSGIANLRKRLNLLYGGNFELLTDKSDEYYTAFLTVPL